MNLLVTCPVCDTQIGTDCDPLPESHSPLKYRHDRAHDLLDELFQAGFIPEEYLEEADLVLSLRRLA